MQSIIQIKTAEFDFMQVTEARLFNELISFY